MAPTPPLSIVRLPIAESGGAGRSMVWEVPAASIPNHTSVGAAELSTQGPTRAMPSPVASLS